MEKGKGLGIKHYILIFAIAVVFLLFIIYLIDVVYPKPGYEKYCKVNLKTQRFINNSAECNSSGGVWREAPSAKGMGWCDLDYFCNRKYNSAREIYERNLFFINITFGLVVIFISFLFSIESVSAGLMGGGVLLLIYGTIRYWGKLSNVLRAVVLGIVLLILVIIGYKKFK